MKKCLVCETEISNSRTYCSDICRVLMRRARKIYRDETRANVDFNNEETFAKFLFKLWIDQEGLCEYTKIEMTPKSKQPNTVSVDRIYSIDSNGKAPYSKNNIVLCCNPINIMKNTFDPHDFPSICFLLFYEYCKNIGNDNVIKILENFHDDIEEEVFKDAIKMIQDLENQYNKKE